MDSPHPRYIFTISAKKRKRPNYRYEGILRTHRFYIDYYTLLEGEEVSKAISTEKPTISFPARFTELVIEFAKELGGRVIEERKITPPKASGSYVRPIVALPNEVAFRRHLLFALTASTFRKPNKLNTLRSLVLSLNANFLNILTNIALERYAELKSRQDPAWHWYMLRVGRAVKVLYKLDR